MTKGIGCRRKQLWNGGDDLVVGISSERDM